MPISSSPARRARRRVAQGRAGSSNRTGAPAARPQLEVDLALRFDAARGVVPVRSDAGSPSHHASRSTMCTPKSISTPPPDSSREK